MTSSKLLQRTVIILAALIATRHATAQYDISKPFDETGCINRAVSESNQQADSIAKKYFHSSGRQAQKATANTPAGYQTEIDANQAILDARKADCAAQMQQWQQLKDQSVAAQIAAANLSAQAAISTYGAGTNSNAPHAIKDDAHQPVWRYLDYEFQQMGQEVISNGGAENTLYISDVVDIASLPNNLQISQSCEASRRELGAIAWFLGLLNQDFNIKTPFKGSCGGNYGLDLRYGVGVHGAGYIIDPNPHTFRTKEEAEVRRADQIARSTERVVQVHGN